MCGKMPYAARRRCNTSAANASAGMKTASVPDPYLKETEMRNLENVPSECPCGCNCTCGAECPCGDGGCGCGCGCE